MNYAEPLYEITTASTKSTYPVSLTECKDQLGLVFSQDYDDNYIERLIKAATEECEAIIQKDIAYTTNVAQLWEFSGTEIKINKGNFNDFVSIVDDTSTSRITTSSTLRVYPEYFYIELTDTCTSDPLTVTYTTGYDDKATPELIKQAVLVKVKSLYDMERDDYSGFRITDNKVAERLLNKYKSVSSLF